MDKTSEQGLRNLKLFRSFLRLPKLRWGGEGPEISRQSRLYGATVSNASASNVKGCKRHIIVEVLGLVVSCYGAANIADVCPCDLGSSPGKMARIVLVLADQSYRGAIAMRLQQAYDCVWNSPSGTRGLLLNRGAGWSSARSRGWRTPIACADDEELPEHHEGFIYVTDDSLGLQN